MEDRALRKWAKDTVAHSKTTTGLERLLGAKHWARLQKARETHTSPEAVMAKADAIMATHDETLRQRFGGLMPSHMIDGDVIPEAGVIHRLNDARGREAFKDVFNTKFWSTPVAAKDLTLRDDLEILPVEQREINFGKPTKEKVKVPGVV